MGMIVFAWNTFYRAKSHSRSAGYTDLGLLCAGSSDIINYRDILKRKYCDNYQFDIPSPSAYCNTVYTLAACLELILKC